jgi:hypothetical protein
MRKSASELIRLILRIWEFVRFAQEKGLKLDFTTPPRRPDPRESLERLLDELPKAP